MTEFMNFACDGLQDFACGMSSNYGGPLGSVPIGRSSWTRVRLMILGQSLLQPSKHLGRATRERMEPTQSDKHEMHTLDAKSRDGIPALLIGLQAI